MTLFTGRVSSKNLTIPFNRAAIRQSTYVIRVSSKDKILFENSLKLFDN